MTLHPAIHQPTQISQSSQPTQISPPRRHAPSSRGPRRLRRRAPWAGAAALSAAALSAAALLALASPAAAHDQLLSASPSAGTAVLETPRELSLTFSGNLITGEGISNVATVTDENGHQWQDGEAQTSGPELSAALCEGMPNGEYAVSYRVVYSDGHSEEKSYDFTLEDPSAPEEGVPEDCGVVNPDAPVSSDATAEDAGTSGSSEAGAEPGASGAATTDGVTPSAGTGADTGAGAGSDGVDAIDQAGEPTAGDSQAPAAAVPGWVWAAAIGGVLVVVLAVIVVFRKAKAIDTGSERSGRGGSGTDEE